ncbi:unnamed protein product [Owenia fusiformis]|uniref:Uncharacterized protein n=1 Tax=Owenia fusiformis TaxID=6347 RepID=A0A8J1XVK4_OWEFU|nr:unnamed protein product [Owenia fusiformis]
MPKTLAQLINDGTIINKAGETVKIEDIAKPGKHVGLYFSAHWCPPCRGFTPVLTEFYNKVKASDKADKLEIIFLSSDRDEKSFKDYFGEMPWLALSFGDDDIKGEVSSEFNIRGIPSLIIIDGATGEVKSSDGRGLVSSDVNGEKFPWGL